MAPGTVGRDAAITSEDLDEQRLRRLIEVGRSLVSERDLETLLTQVLDDLKTMVPLAPPLPSCSVPALMVVPPV